MTPKRIGNWTEEELTLVLALHEERPNERWNVAHEEVQRLSRLMRHFRLHAHRDHYRQPRSIVQKLQRFQALAAKKTTDVTKMERAVWERFRDAPERLRSDVLELYAVHLWK